MAECGWPDARLLEQQDTSEAFAFLTEKLELPLLSLQVDLFHQGKHDKDDHKIVYERLLNLAVPSDSGGNGIKLEDCLEEYFNTQVDVLRDSEEAKKSIAEDGTLSLSPKLLIPNQIRLVRDEENVATPTVVTSSPIQMSSLKPLADILLEKDEEGKDEEGKDEVEKGEDEKGEDEKAEEKKDEKKASPPEQVNGTTQVNPPGDVSQSTVAGDHTAASSSSMAVRHRSASVIQRVMLDDQGRPASSENMAMRKRLSLKGSTVIRAVTIPAWQFFRLIRTYEPWQSLLLS